MKKLIPLLILASIGHVQAANLTINGFTSLVEDDKVIENVQKISSCSPKALAKKSDYAQVTYLAVTKQHDLMAKYLIEKCITLNNEEIRKQDAAKTTDSEPILSNPIKFANSQENLLYMFAAKAPLDKVDGKELIFYLGSNPTNFNKKDSLLQKKFGEEGIQFIKKQISGPVLGSTADLSKFYTATQKEEENYDLMLATMIKWIPSSVRFKEKNNGNYLSHYFSYMGRHQALKAITEIELPTISLTRVNVFGETPKMVAFKPYCGIVQKWQKDSLLATQLLLIEKISLSDTIRKNTYGNTLSDYVKNYLDSNEDKESNLLITNQLKKSSPDLFKTNKAKKLTPDFVGEFCQK